MLRHVQKFFVLFLLLSLIIVGCKAKDKKDNSHASNSDLPQRLQEIQEKGKLVVGTAITRPFEYYDDDGQLIGFDVDLMNLMADRLDVSIEWQEMAFADLLSALSAGNVDIVIASMYIRPDREEVVDMSQPYLDTGLVMVVQGNETEIDDFSDLAGRTVGVKEGSTGAAYAQRLIEEDEIALELRIYTDTVDSLDDLDAGLVDVVFNDRLNTLVYIQAHPNVRIQGDVFDPAGLGISVQTGDVDLLNFVNDFLDTAQASGDIDRLFDKWINPETLNQ